MLHLSPDLRWRTVEGVTYVANLARREIVIINREAHEALEHLAGDDACLGALRSANLLGDENRESVAYPPWVLAVYASTNLIEEKPEQLPTGPSAAQAMASKISFVDPDNRRIARIVQQLL